MQQPEIDIEKFEVFAAGVDHSECVAFDSDGVLWAGGEAGQIYRIDDSGKAETVANLPGFCGGIAFSPDDELFVCQPGSGVVRVKKSGEQEVFAEAAGGYKLVSPNFGVFARNGDYYVTDSGKWRERNGCLLRFTPDGTGQVLAGPMGYANGLALTADESILYMVESDTNSVLKFQVNQDHSLSPPETFATEVGRLPDGLALDAEGNLYVSCYASDEIFRISAAGQKSLFAYDPWGNRLGAPTNMAFGVKDPEVMYFANLARTTITRVKTGRRGQPLANHRGMQ